MPDTTHLIYFSPTGTTKRIVTAIAEGLGTDAVMHHDLTRATTGLDLRIDAGLAIIGVPVYAGRVPQVFLDRIGTLAGSGVPAVLVAIYGNRAYEDALIELRDVIRARGFSLIAAGAFIGEHSYSTQTSPVAAGRPDAADLQKAREFGVEVSQRMQSGNSATERKIPGHSPYKERVPLGGIAPDTDRERCTLCGTCATLCPTFAITVTHEVVTVASSCIMCCACVKHCPTQARALNHPMVATRREMLTSTCHSRKEPELFLE